MEITHSVGSASLLHLEQEYNDCLGLVRTYASCYPILASVIPLVQIDLSGIKHTTIRRYIVQWSR